MSASHSPGEYFVVGTRVLTPSGMGPAALHIAHGKIVAVTKREAVPAGAAVKDAGDAVVMPGVVDTHVHVNEPGRTEWEGFASATRAAAAGGVTTLVDMPLNSIPPTTTVANLMTKAAAMEGRIAVDVGLWGGAIPGNAGDLRAMLGAGALGFKCFMVESGVDEFPCVNGNDLRAAMLALRDTNAPLLAHAELSGPIDEALASGVLPTDARSYRRYLLSRPKSAEDLAVALLAELCTEIGARVHVVHLSSAGVLDTLRRARDAKLPLSAETAPHYLHFDAETIPDGATPYKCAPPIREHENREQLWKGLREGLVSMVVTDHSPCTPELKKLTAGSFDDAWGGIASLQLGFSVIWTEAHARGIPFETVVGWMASAPAKLAGLEGRKGALQVGNDADFVLFRPDATFTVDAAELQHRNKITPYQGQVLRGVVDETYVRGENVYSRGEFSPRLSGQWVKRAGA